MTVHISQHGWFRAVDQSGQTQSFRKSIFRRLVGRIENFAFRRSAAKAFIAVSARLKNDLREFHGLSDQVEVIHHGIDTDVFHPDNVLQYRNKVRQSHSIPESALLGLYVGDWQKAGQVLTDIVKKMPDLRLLVCTKSALPPIIEQVHIAGVSDRIVFAPPTREIERLYAAADFFLFPSFYDTFGMVVAEAMATGLPVIVSRQSGASEWIHHGRNGFILESANDPVAWSQAIRELENDSGLRKFVGEAARQTCLEHSWDRVADATMQVYKRVVDSAPSRHRELI
jgi:UDP-glucose:(heptosyl)LPS alpha-1,3-glucosyltransferase